MKTGAAFVGFLFSAGVGFAVGWAVGSGSGGPSGGGGGTMAPGAKAADASALPVGDSYVKGPNDALVTLIEFSDFECPFCSRVNPTIKQIQDTYGKDVRIVFKHNPLPFHKNAPLASEYALAAGEQGKFWEMHDKLFANQKALLEPQLKEYAAQLGLDQAKIDAFIASGKGKKAIADDQALASKVGARGTPNFFVNGAQVTGAQPFDNFKKVIDEQIAIAKKKVAAGTPRDKVYAAVLAENPPKPAPPPQRPQAPPATRQKVSLSDATPQKGGKMPLVTIVEFSDFECPFCSRVNPTLAQVMKEYGDKVQIRFRHQPLPFHKRAMPAAKASLAAHKQGKFWEMHDKLFANQKALQDADLEKYAKEIGLNVTRFKADMNSDAITKQVAADQADAGKWGARGTPTLFVNGVPVRGAQPFAAFKTVIDKEIELANKLLKEGVKKADLHAEIIKREAGKEVAGAAPGAAKPAAPAKPQDVKLGRAPIVGNKNAPVKVVLWSDFECPFCGRVNPSIEQIKKEYGNKVVVAFKHFPLPFHKNATPAAVASLAAHRQGKFWEMHDKLFENQRALQRTDLERYAEELGLDMAKFKKDMDDPELEAWVKADMAEGSKVGVNGTPATYINGRKVSGAQPFPAFKAIIDEELKKG
ncbi:MAG: thioredoxin domain-containing protein [Deltaproteobacteria bacterium]|jgi:protein-disulfide isomerase